MKTSNKLLLGFLCLIIAFLVISTLLAKRELNKVIPTHTQLSSNQATNNSLFADSTKVTLSMDRNTSVIDITNYTVELKKLNIDLKVDKIEFDSNNKIKFISISVDCNDGFKGSVNQTMEENDKIGFYRVYDKSNQSPFGMCPLE
jgi:hypothetical protein